jgi:PAS domain S-box-containing protein
LDINPRFERLFGYSLAEIKGKHLDDVIVQKERLEEAGNLNQRVLQGYVYHDTLRRRKDGTLIPVSISAAPITVEDRLEGYVGMYKDISELRNTEEALKETMGKLATINEKLRVVGSLTRHDVQNKLTLVTGNAYLMKKKAISDPETLERLRGIEEACRQIVEIFDFARSYETLGEEELRYVDVADAFDKAASQFGDLKGISTDNECKGLIVLADSLLTRLFYNLVDNSLKYGEKLTYMRIRMEKGREELKLIYEDDGVGIPLAEKSKLFTKGHGKGTGLGLYLIKKIMEAYGWAIKETGEPGKSAQFTITIPTTNHKSKENYRIT